MDNYLTVFKECLRKVTCHWRQWAERQQRDVLMIYLAGRDPRVPWYAKALAQFVAGYTLSPIDLIPDFIPIVGHLDDLVLLPLGVLLVVRLIPAAVIEDLRAQAARRRLGSQPASLAAAGFILLLWLLVALLAARFLSP